MILVPGLPALPNPPWIGCTAYSCGLVHHSHSIPTARGVEYEIFFGGHKDRTIYIFWILKKFRFVSLDLKVLIPPGQGEPERLHSCSFGCQRMSSRNSQYHWEGVLRGSRWSYPQAVWQVRGPWHFSGLRWEMQWHVLGLDPSWLQCAVWLLEWWTWRLGNSLQNFRIQLPTQIAVSVGLQESGPPGKECDSCTTWCNWVSIRNKYA